MSRLDHGLGLSLKSVNVKSFMLSCLIDATLADEDANSKFSVDDVEVGVCDNLVTQMSYLAIFWHVFGRSRDPVGPPLDPQGPSRPTPLPCGSTPGPPALGPCSAQVLPMYHPISTGCFF